MALMICIFVWLQAIAMPFVLISSLPDNKAKKPIVTFSTAIIGLAVYMNLMNAI